MVQSIEQVFQLIDCGQLEQAEQTLARIRAIDPNKARLALYHSWLEMRRGDWEAVLEYTELVPEGYEYIQRMNRGIAYHQMGDTARAQKALDEFIELNSHDAAVQIAVVYAQRGDADTTFEWLDKAIEIRDPGLMELNLIWSFDALHDDPRWDALLERVGLKAVMVD